MKNFFKVLMVLGTLLLGACQQEEASAVVSQTNDISDQKVYFFYQTTCPHCHHAAAYITQKYPNLKMVNLDVRTKQNFDLFLKCAKKFNLPQNSLGTPLICMGNHYIMGWSDADANKFDIYVRRFK